MDLGLCPLILHGNTLRNTSAHGGFGSASLAGLAQGFSHASTRDSFPGAWGCTRTDSTSVGSWCSPTGLKHSCTFLRARGPAHVAATRDDEELQLPRRARQEGARDLLRSLHRGVRDLRAAGVETGERS